MHTPVITLVGDHHVQRTTYSIMKYLKITDTIAYHPDEYVEKAVYFIEHPNVLTDVKERISKALRDETRNHSKVYVRNLETAFQTMWRRYLNGEPLQSISV